MKQTDRYSECEEPEDVFLQRKCDPYLVILGLLIIIASLLIGGFLLFGSGRSIH